MARPLAPRPKKPSRNFPLFPHRDGTWKPTTSIAGRKPSFGSWVTDPTGEAALARWRAATDAIEAGTVNEPLPAFASLKSTLNAFLVAKLASPIEPRSYAAYQRDLKSFSLIVPHGPTRLVNDLRPADFAVVRAQWSKTMGPYRLANCIQSVKAAFRWAGPDGQRLIDRLPHYGAEFQKPTAMSRRAAVRKSGVKLFTPAEVRKIIRSSSTHPTLRACVLLGVNAGFYAVDCARLRETDLNLKTGFLDFIRQKRETPRRAVLWPETITAIRAAMKARPDPARPEHAGLVFLTRLGNPVAHDTVHRTADDSISKVTPTDSLNQSLTKLLDGMGLKKQNIGFGSFRRTFRTMADEHGDHHAAALVMGHVATDVASLYVQRVSHDRLRRLSDYVRKSILRPPKGSAR